MIIWNIEKLNEIKGSWFTQQDGIDFYRATVAIEL